MARARDYAAEYQRRLAKESEKLGKPPGHLTAEERKIARGHERTEGHGFRPSEIKRKERAGWQVGKPAKKNGPVEKSGFAGGATPTNREALAAVRKITTGDILIYVQVVSTEQSPTKAPPSRPRKNRKPPSGKVVETIATRQDRLLVQDVLQREPDPVAAVHALFRLTRPIEAVISWQFFPVAGT